VLGTLWRGDLNAFATNAAVRDYRIVLIHHGLPGLFYMVALAMTAAWSAAPAPAGRTAAFNPTEERVRDRLSKSSVAISALAGTLTAYLYSGDPWRTPLSRVESERTMPLGVLLSLASRQNTDVIDETPAAYKLIDDVMNAQKDLVEIVRTLRQAVCVKG
jgi:hypothetical protein